MKLIDSVISESSIIKKIKQGHINPLKIKKGQNIHLQEPDIQNVDLSVQKITRHKSESKNYTQIDYHLNGECPFLIKKIELRIRIILECEIFKIQLFYLLEKNIYSSKVIKNFEKSKELCIEKDEDGELLDVPRKYWHIDNGSILVDSLSSSNNNLYINEISKISFWKFCRDTQNFYGQKLTEIFYIELNHQSNNYHSLRGSDIEIDQIAIG